MTTAQVDPIALRQKLRKLGIGTGLPMSQTFAEDAVRDVCTWHRVSEKELPADAPTLRLEPEELAYCLHNWAQLWEVPA